MLVYFHLGKKRLQIEGKIVTFSFFFKKKVKADFKTYKCLRNYKQG